MNDDYLGRRGVLLIAEAAAQFDGLRQSGRRRQVEVVAVEARIAKLRREAEQAARTAARAGRRCGRNAEAGQ